jgi:addiction module HigA family antidote
MPPPFWTTLDRRLAINLKDSEGIGLVNTVHPGEILEEEFLKPLNLTAYRTAKLLHVSRPRIERLIRCQVPVTPDTALRLGRLFGTTGQFWMTLQSRYDLELREDAAMDDLAAIDPLPNRVSVQTPRPLGRPRQAG